jgi:hypothetical protein
MRRAKQYPGVQFDAAQNGNGHDGVATRACRVENVTAAATSKGRKQVYAWRVPAI